jgi:thiamine biosynthesis protein ThiI
MQYCFFVKYELILIRYAELGLKATETRNRFENTLINNIRNALKTKEISFELRRERGRIYVFTNQINKSIDVLQKIFGITSISPAVKTSSKMEAISKVAIDISKEKLTKKKSFALRVTRTGNHSFTSQDVAVQIGNDVVKATNSSVNLTNPDFELFIEIRDKNAYLFIQKIRCNGGLPLRTQGKILVLVDSLESILAA